MRDFRLGSAAPREIARPASRDELCEILERASRDRLAIVPWGGGVGFAHEAAPARYDLAIDLTALDRVVEYEPEDVTVTVECGVTVAALGARLAARGQELPLEAPHADRATLGGALAANASGPRRLRFGAPRDRILGATFALAEGTIVRTGGKVVKNVAGYGIHRLLCGSRGGLAILIEASLKLATAPEARRALIYRAGAGDVADAKRWAPLTRLEPAFVSVVSATEVDALAVPSLATAAGEAVVAIGLEDDAPWVSRQAELVTRALGEPVVRLEGADARMLAQRLADLENAAARLTFTTAANTPAALAALEGEASTPRFVFHAPAGRLHLFPNGADSSPEMIRRLAERGFTLIGATGVPDAKAALAPMVATLRLRTRIREALDPARAMALGDRWERGAL
jgi:glycolate oxidase FAD binding subunit